MVQPSGQARPSIEKRHYLLFVCCRASPDLQQSPISQTSRDSYRSPKCIGGYGQPQCFSPHPPAGAARSTSPRTRHSIHHQQPQQHLQQQQQQHKQQQQQQYQQQQYQQQHLNMNSLQQNLYATPHRHPAPGRNCRSRDGQQASIDIGMVHLTLPSSPSDSRTLPPSGHHAANTFNLAALTNFENPANGSNMVYNNSEHVSDVQPWAAAKARPRQRNMHRWQAPDVPRCKEAKGGASGGRVTKSKDRYKTSMDSTYQWQRKGSNMSGMACQEMSPASITAGYVHHGDSPHTRSRDVSPVDVVMYKTPQNKPAANKRTPDVAVDAADVYQHMKRRLAACDWYLNGNGSGTMLFGRISDSSDSSDSSDGTSTCSDKDLPVIPDAATLVHKKQQSQPVPQLKQRHTQVKSAARHANALSDKTNSRDHILSDGSTHGDDTWTIKPGPQDGNGSTDSTGKVKNVQHNGVMMVCYCCCVMAIASSVKSTMHAVRSSCNQLKQ